MAAAKQAAHAAPETPAVEPKAPGKQTIGGATLYVGALSAAERETFAALRAKHGGDVNTADGWAALVAAALPKASDAERADLHPWQQLAAVEMAARGEG